MKIGMTYDLRAEYLLDGYSEEETAELDSVSTVEAIEASLRELGHTVERIGTVRRLISRLSVGRRWDLVFNICEGLRGFGREAVVPALLEVYGIPCTFSDPLAMSLSLHKGLAKRVVRDLGIPTPEFAIVNSEDDIDRIDIPYPLFAKPIAEGTSKGVDRFSLIADEDALRARCRGLLGRFAQPVLVERYLPGREFTVGILGTGDDADVVGVLEINLLNESDKEVYTYENKENCEKFVEYRLAHDDLARRAACYALEAWRGIGGRDAGRVDLREDHHGIPCFVELNPLAGMNPTHSDLPIVCGLAGMSYRDLVERIVISAVSRSGVSAVTSVVQAVGVG